MRQWLSDNEGWPKDMESHVPFDMRNCVGGNGVWFRKFLRRRGRL